MKRPIDIYEGLKALSHPGRLQFLTWLKQPEQYFGLSAAEAREGVAAGRFEMRGLSQSAASQHLAVLQRAGLLCSRRVCSTILYRRDEENIALLKRLIAGEITTAPEPFCHNTVVEHTHSR